MRLCNGCVNRWLFDVPADLETHVSKLFSASQWYCRQNLELGGHFITVEIKQKILKTYGPKPSADSLVKFMVYHFLSFLL